MQHNKRIYQITVVAEPAKVIPMRAVKLTLQQKIALADEMINSNADATVKDFALTLKNLLQP